MKQFCRMKFGPMKIRNFIGEFALLLIRIHCTSLAHSHCSLQKFFVFVNSSTVVHLIHLAKNFFLTISIYIKQKIYLTAMDFPDLNFIRSDIDPAMVKPIDNRDLIRIFNDFLLVSSNLLNNFCAKFEGSIQSLEARMDAFEEQLILLERKLADIPVGAVQQNELQVKKEENNIENIYNKEEPEQSELTRQEMPESSKSEQGKCVFDGKLAARQHPSWGKYFRMLKMGVPTAAVKQKMVTEGVDPAILDDPDRLVQVSKECTETEDVDECTSSSSSSFAES